MSRNAVPGDTRGSLFLDVRESDWSAGISDEVDETEPVLLLSLPRGLFLAHEEEMRRSGAARGPAVSSDTEYLSTVWGFTRTDRDDMTEIADVPLVTVGLSGGRLSVRVAGCPWLFGRAPSGLPRSWRCPSGGVPVLLGICFGVDLGGPGAGDRFLSELADGEAVLGQVDIVPEP